MKRDEKPAMVGGIRRNIYIAIGGVLVAIGAVGAIIPGLPTTIFLLMAAWFFVRSSPRLHRRLLNHPKFGPPLRRFIESRAMTGRAKTRSLMSMWVGIAVASLLIRNAPMTIRLIVPLAGVVGTVVIVFLVRTEEWDECEAGVSSDR